MDSTVPETATPESAVMALESVPEAAVETEDVTISTTTVEAAPSEPESKDILEDPRVSSEQPEATMGDHADAELILTALPEGSETILGDSVEWYTNENGGKSCNITEEQARLLKKLAEEQGMEVHLFQTSDPETWKLTLTA